MCGQSRAVAVFVLLTGTLHVPGVEPARDSEGHPLPVGAVSRIGSARLQHERAATAAVFTPDGKRIVSAGADRAVCVWDAANGKLLTRWLLAAESDPVALAVSRKGDSVLVAFPAGALVLHELDGGKVRHVLRAGANQPPKPFYAVRAVFGADDKTLLTRNADGTATLWECATGKEVKTHRPAVLTSRSPGVGLGSATGDRFTEVALGADGKTLAYCIPGQRVVVLDAADGKELRSVPVTSLSLALSPDGKTLAVTWSNSSGVGGNLALWDVEKGKELTTTGRGSVQAGAAIRFSPDGRLLSVRSGTDTAHELILGATSGLELRKIQSRRPSVAAVSDFSPDGRHALLVTSGSSRIRVFDIENECELLGDSELGVHASTLLWLADDRVAAVDGDSVQVFEIATGKRVGTQQLHGAKELAGPVVVTKDRKGLIWGTNRGMLRTWVPGEPLKETAVVEAVKPAEGLLPPQVLLPPVVSPDGRYFAYSHTTAVWHLRDLTDNSERELPRAGKSVAAAIGFSPDSKELFLRDPEGLVRWDTATLTRLPIFNLANREALTPVEQAVGGRCAAVMISDAIVVYESLTGTERARVDLPALEARPRQPSNFLPVYRPTCVSPDGMLLARTTPTEEVKVVFVGESVTKVVQTLAAGQGKVTAVGFTPDGRRLAVARDNGTVLFWDVLGEWRKPADRPGRKLEKEEIARLWRRLLDCKTIDHLYVISIFVNDPERTLPYLKEVLKPRPAPTQDDIAKWINELVSNTRLDAAEDLIEAGQAARVMIQQKFKELGTDPKAVDERTRLNFAFVHEQGVSALELRRCRAIEVLERIATAEARELIEALAKGPADSNVTNHAQAALKRMTPLK